MKYSTTTSVASRCAGSCVIVGIYDSGKLGEAATDIDKASKGLIRKQIKSGDLSGRLGSSRMLGSIGGVKAQRVLVIGLGKPAAFGVTQFKRATQAAMTVLNSSKIVDATNYLTLESVEGASPYYLARYAVQTVGESLYRFTEMKSSRRKSPIALKSFKLALQNRGDASKVTRGIEHAGAIVEGMALAKDLGNLPPNVCTPSYLGRTAQRLASGNKNLQTRVIGEAEMKRLGMHSLLSVTAGTVLPAKLIVMKYKGAAKQAPVVLVGKGVTFDAGGISLKPGQRRRHGTSKGPRQPAA